MSTQIEGNVVSYETVTTFEITIPETGQSYNINLNSDGTWSHNISTAALASAPDNIRLLIGVENAAGASPITTVNLQRASTQSNAPQFTASPAVASISNGVADVHFATDQVVTATVEYKKAADSVYTQALPGGQSGQNFEIDVPGTEAIALDNNETYDIRVTIENANLETNVNITQVQTSGEITMPVHFPYNGVNIINKQEGIDGITLNATILGEEGQPVTLTCSEASMNVPNTTVSGGQFPIELVPAELAKVADANEYTITAEVNGKQAIFRFEHHTLTFATTITATAYQPGQDFDVTVDTASGAGPWDFDLEIRDTSDNVLHTFPTENNPGKPTTFNITQGVVDTSGWPTTLRLRAFVANRYRNGEEKIETIGVSSAMVLDFSNDVALGSMSASNWADVFGGAQWFSQNNQFVQIGEFHGRRGMRVKNVPASNGTARVNGAFHVDPGQSYRVKFSSYFEDTPANPWSYGTTQRGGKMGFGFRGGTAPDGNTPMPDGMTARIMWRDDNDDDVGELEGYIYHADQPGNSGDQITLVGYDIPLNTWFDIEMLVTMNSSTAASDGVLQISADGVMYVNRSNMRYFSAGIPEINGLTWADFYGGNSSDWSPANDTFQVFANVEYEKLA